MTSPEDLLYAFRTNMVVTASAGTGKTFRLVALYTMLTLGLTSQGQDRPTEAAPSVLPSRIGATTFSRAAAAEIRERVERLLVAVSRDQYDSATLPYRAILQARAELTGLPPISSRVMRERAEAALADLPHALIDTLHGLAGRIVRGSALELGMNPGFAILEDDGGRSSTEGVVDEVLSRALTRGDRGATLLLDAGGGLVGTRLRVAQLLDRADEEGVDIADLACTDFAPDAAALMTRLIDICRSLCEEKSKAFSDAASLVLAATARFSFGDLDAEGPLAEAIEPLFSVRAPARPSAAEESFAVFRAGISGENHPARAHRLAAFFASAHDLEARTRAIAQVVSEIAERRAEARKEAGNLGFGDLLRLARNGLRDDGELARRWSSSFDVLLVDEFQDTSSVQRDLIYLLREARHDHRPTGPRRGNERGQIPRADDLLASGLLIVGDRKQSIYGFRGADVTVFTRVAAELAGRSAAEALCLSPDTETPERPNAELISLRENRRSHPAILQFVNWFATRDFGAGSPYPFDITYAQSEHLCPPGNLAPGTSPGSTRLETLEAGSIEDGLDAPRVVVVSDDGDRPEGLTPLVNGAQGPMRDALIAAGIVDRAVRDSAYGPLRFGDFAILARRRSTLPLLEFGLARLGIPYVVAGRALFDTREVRDVFAVLRLILDPYNRHALAVVLRGPALALSEASLALLSEPGRGLTSFGAWLRPETGIARRLPDDERERLLRFASRFKELAQCCLGLAPADVIRYAVEKLELDRVIAALPHAAPRFGNLTRFISLASQRGGSLPSFVRWLERQIADQSDESEASMLTPGDDAVTLMTIHGSKGLEFRAVLVVDLGAAARPANLSLALGAARAKAPARLIVRHSRAKGGPVFTPEWAEFWREATAREVAERRRLTYVAMTRARERLFLLASQASPPGSAGATLKAHLPELIAPEQLLGEAPSQLGGVSAAVEPATPYLLREPLPISERAATREGPRTWTLPARSGVGDVSISTTPLATFDQCPRRYRLIHELGVEPPAFLGRTSSTTASDAPHAPLRDERRVTGTAAHRVLERWPLARLGEPLTGSDVLPLLVAEGLLPDAETTRTVADQLASFLSGPYAAQLRTATAVHREEPFVVDIRGPRGVLALRGTIDLLVAYSDGSADVIDYKSSWQRELSDHSFQLQAYALAARRRFGLAPVRAGIVDLARGPEPISLRELPERALLAFEEQLESLRDRFTQARSSEFDGIARSSCEALRCGFVRACHDGKRA